MNQNDFEKDMGQAIDLGRSMGVMAEKRDMSPIAMHMAAANSLASCLATAATMHIIMRGLTRTQAIEDLKDTGIDILTHVMKQAIYKVHAADIEKMVQAFNSKDPDNQMPELKEGWDN